MRSVGISAPTLIIHLIVNWGDITKLPGVFLCSVLAQGDEQRSGARRCVRLFKDDLRRENTLGVIIMPKLFYERRGGGRGYACVGVLYAHSVTESGCHPET